jgi:hypothetical protein
MRPDRELSGDLSTPPQPRTTTHGESEEGDAERGANEHP